MNKFTDNTPVFQETLSEVLQTTEMIPERRKGLQEGRKNT